MNAPVFIVDALRTPLGRGGPDGGLHELKPVVLLTTALEALQARIGFDAAAMGDLVVGVAEPIGELGSGLARCARAKAGWGAGAGWQVSRQHASGLEAVLQLAAQMAAGTSGMAVAAAVDAPSRVPPGSSGGPAVEDPTCLLRQRGLPPGIAADLLATMQGARRQDLDAYAVRSQQRALLAHERTTLRSTIAVHDAIGLELLAHDEGLQPLLEAASLAQRDAAYGELGDQGFDDMALAGQPGLARIDHVHTAGNRAAWADGAAALLLAGPGAGLKPRARIAAWARTGASGLLDGAVRATQRLLEAAGLSAAQVDLFAMLDAHAIQALHFVSTLGIPDDRLNVDGGAVARGLAPGAGGAMLLVDLLDGLEARGLRRGVVAVDANGEGLALLVERD